PKYPDGISLRYAMVHDVLHERYPRHGKAYYTERNRQARAALRHEKGKVYGDGKPSPLYFSLLDDLGAGLDALGEHEAAVRLLRDKLREQETLGIAGRDRYTTYANLGTFLIHANARRAAAGDAEARKQLAEAEGFI